MNEDMTSQPAPVSTNDPYPSHFQIEIDRERLKNYLRASRMLVWTLSPCLIVGFLGFAAASGHVQRADFPLLKIIWMLISGIGTGMGIGAVTGMLGYFVFSRRAISRYVESLEISVEGAFLRVREGASIKTDRKLHFRSIVDYTTCQDSLMRRLGIHTLHLATIGGGPRSTVVVPGIKDCEKVRDLLSEVDRIRENQ